MAQQDLGGQGPLIIKAAWSAHHWDLYLKTHYTNRRHPCHPQYSNPPSHQGMGHRPTPQTTVSGGLPHGPYSVDMSSFFETEISGDHKCRILQYTALVSLYLLPFKRNLPDKCATTCSFCTFFPRNPVHTEKWKPNIYSKYYTFPCFW